MLFLGICVAFGHDILFFFLWIFASLGFLVSSLALFIWMLWIFSVGFAMDFIFVFLLFLFRAPQGPFLMMDSSSFFGHFSSMLVALHRPMVEKGYICHFDCT